MSVERVGTHEAKTHLSEYLNRVRYGGERILIERHGRPVAGLVGVEDLERLEGLSGGERGAEARYRESLEQAGIQVRWTEGRSSEGARRRRRVSAKGNAVSERIISERR